MVNHHCCVVGCNSSTRIKKRLWKYPWMEGVQFFVFPRQMSEKRIWKRLLRRENFEITRHTRICSLHWIGDGPSVKEPHPTVFPYNEKMKKSTGRISSVRHSMKRDQHAADQHLAPKHQLAPGMKKQCDATSVRIRVEPPRGIIYVSNDDVPLALHEEVSCE